MNLFQFVTHKERLSRGGFWFLTAVVWLAFYLLSNAVGSGAWAFLTWPVNGLALMSLVLLCIKRLHDRSYSGWYFLLVLIPVAGALWLLWQCAFRRGSPHMNGWGQDPTQPGGEYLVVR